MALSYKHGKDSRCYAEGQDVTGVLREISRAAAVDTAETSVMGTSDKTYIAGHRDETITLGGLFDGSTARTHEVLADGLGTSPSTSNGVITYGPVGSSQGAPASLVNGTVTGFDVTSPAQDVVAASVTVQGSGGKPAKNLGKFLTAGSTTRSSSAFAGAAVTFGSTAAASTAGGVAHIHVTAMTTGVATLTVQHTSGVGYADKGSVTITKTTSSTALRGYRIPLSGTMEETWRTSGSGSTWTSTSITFAIALARY